MARARIRNRRKPVAEMNVVPYIDVMLVPVSYTHLRAHET